MIILEHGKKHYRDLKNYKAKCFCGCIFQCNEYEFTREKRPNGKVFIRCPDCGKTIYKDNMNEIINSKEVIC